MKDSPMNEGMTTKPPRPNFDPTLGNPKDTPSVIKMDAFLKKESNPLIHVAVMVPGNVATTILLNAFAEHGGFFVYAFNVPVKSGGGIADLTGKERVEMVTVMVFGLPLLSFKAWQGEYIPQKTYEYHVFLESPPKASRN